MKSSNDADTWVGVWIAKSVDGELENDPSDDSLSNFRNGEWKSDCGEGK